MRVYLDAAPVIYLVERIPPFASKVISRLSRPGDSLYASDLTRMECRIKPIRQGNLQLLEDFEQFFRENVDGMLSLTHEVVDRATEIRARHGFKTPDALHLAAAVTSRCDVFLTNDHRLDAFTAVAIEVVGDA